MAAVKISTVYFVILFLFYLLGEDSAKLLPKSTHQKRSGANQNANAAVMMRKVRRFLELMEKEPGLGSVELSLKEYQELIFESPRNHTTFVLFYNDEDMCASCEAVVYGFKKIARSFRRAYMKYDEKTSMWDVKLLAFFVTVKMSEEYRNILLDVVPTKPSLFYFAPAHSSKYNQFEKMDQDLMTTESRGIYNLNRMLAFIEHISDIRVPLEKESPPSSFASNVLSGALMILLVLYNLYHFGYWDWFMGTIRSGNYTQFITIIIIWLLSGQMFNYIRYTPMFGNNGFTIMSIIYPGMRYQYGVESIVIMALYTMVLYSVITLIETRERQLSEGLSTTRVQGTLLGSLSGFYFGFMGLQFISQLKSGG